ncbi:uncharacterized protein FIBRA_01159 [Fibroporia radiculosa]|uniref:Ribosomal protein S21 n=1 Tax=Fibroporia radiculosa TaxID=599839 RepID=J4H0Y2_9APHY|nr:uncharacterized protein FIBRA_01159 [Fibroporia radiculosa]CCL99144.1 predicted protein [Fibroporia radiculosa]
MLSTLARRYAQTVFVAHTVATPTSFRQVRSLSSDFHKNNAPVLKPKWNLNTTEPEPLTTPGPNQESGPKVWAFLLEQARKNASLTSEKAENVWKEREKVIARNLPKPHNTYSGRTVSLHSRTLGAAFGRLRRVLATNKVVKELRMTERHEKKGDKRRRLKSERWRRRFAHEVRKKVQLVNEIRARGS